MPSYDNSRILRITLITLWVFVFFYLLKIGKGILLPLIVALILFYLILLLSQLYQKISIAGKQLSSWSAIGLSFLTFSFCIYWFIFFVANGIREFRDVYTNAYQNKVQKSLSQIVQLLEQENKDVPTTFSLRLPNEQPLSLIQSLDTHTLTESKEEQVSLFKQILDLVESPKEFARSVGKELTTLVGDAGLIMLYLVFIFFEYRHFGNKIEAIYPERSRSRHVVNIMQKINIDIQKYLLVRTVMNLVMAILSYAVMRGVGMDLAGFSAVLIFVFHYVPFIGSIIAFLLPAVISFFQFDPLYGMISWQFILVLSSLLVIKIVFENILEPRWMGTTLNLSPLVILISLTVWGALWGIMGMFLCVPIMSTINITLSHFRETRRLAVFLSEKGNI